jgi:tRNA nucleotidyltransferase/poly(A) polymerase
MVGDPDKRLKEDPLRILRAIRFYLVFNLEFDKKLKEAMTDRFYLLNNITDAKIRQELDKIGLHDDVDVYKKKDIFEQFDIANLQGVIK